MPIFHHHPGGLSAIPLGVPNLPGSPPGVRGSRGTPYTGGGGGNGPSPMPIAVLDYGTSRYAAYGVIVPEIAKAERVAPSDQGRRLLAKQFSNYFPEAPNRAPATTQTLRRYTQPLQVFQTSNTYQNTSPAEGTGNRARQPSVKFVSPFGRLPISTQMPWDL
jgi:hypothetical protein